MRLVLIGIVNGFREIAAHKIRSFLSLLGIIIGVASLVAVFAIVKGMMSGWESWLRLGGGIQKVSITKQKVPEEFVANQSLSEGLTWEDAQALKSCDLLEAISPEISLDGSLIYHDLVYETQIIACTADYFTVGSTLVLAQGRFISDVDIDHANPVLVLGSLAAQEIFGSINPIGQKIVFRDITFEVVGVMQEIYLGKRRRRWVERMNRVCFIPLTKAIAEFQDNTALSSINVRIVDTHDTTPALDQCEQILSVTHHGIPDYQFGTKDEQIASFNERAQQNTIAGALIGGMSLFVGGIGIMNIMLASISERLREIGIRKAIGATSFDIFVQVLFETVSLSVLGGVFGVMASILLVEFLGTIMVESPPVMSIPAMVIGFSFSVVTGVLFGLYPAIRASRLNPIEALRGD